MFIAAGPGILPGRLHRIVSILDFAPTFCEGLGVTFDGFEGNAIPEIAEPLKSCQSRQSRLTQGKGAAVQVQ
jgi:hypothetical protein